MFIYPQTGTKRERKKKMKKTLSIIAAIVLTLGTGNAVLGNTLYASAESDNSDPWYWCGTKDSSSSSSQCDSYDPWYWCGMDDSSNCSSQVSHEEKEGAVTFNEETGVLTLSGKITKEQVWEYRGRRNLTKVIADETCVFPADCSNMFLNAESKTVYTNSGSDSSGSSSGSGAGVGEYYYADYSYFSELEYIDISKADTSKVKNMHGMFNRGQISVNSQADLTTINVSGIDTSNVTDMSDMFTGCNKVRSLDVSSFDTSKVTTMEDMFAGCKALRRLDVSGFDTSNVSNMSGMFLAFKGNMLDISSFDTLNVSDMSSMFLNCDSLKTVYVSDKWVVNEGTNTKNMFSNNSHNSENKSMSIVGGNGTKWSEDHVDGKYARIDKEGEPGYFTLNDGSITIPSQELGDINDDGAIDIEDAVQVIGNVNGLNPLTAEQEKYADVDGSGTIDIEDAVLLISRVNGDVSDFSKNGK